MIRFECDYTEGAHPAIIKSLTETNEEQTPGYGRDIHCDHARELIQQACGQPHAAVHFLVGGTQTNMTVIDSVLRSYQGVISSVSGHINGHEAGAVEGTGHKVLALPSEDGKLTAEQVDAFCKSHFDDPEREHNVEPGMVYISNPTERGLVYSKKELGMLSSVCHRYDIPLFMDGARLGYGLTSKDNDMTLHDITSFCDVFYIGGTKVGALFGEAVVFSNLSIEKGFRYAIKRHGGLLAKGRLLGIQFETLFTDNLYFKISQNANEQALRIHEALEKKGYKFLNDSKTNQQFPLLPDDELNRLEKDFSFAHFGKTEDGLNIVRICTCWATRKDNVDKLIEAI